MQYRKKPVVIEARKLDGKAITAIEIACWVNQRGGHATALLREDGWGVRICTLEGDMDAGPSDYVIEGVKQEHYPCKADIFDATYEPVA